jgi:hypothetical protein
MACLRVLPNCRLEGCRTSQREGNSNPRLVLQDESSKRFREKMIAKDLDVGLETAGCWGHFGSPCAGQLVSGSDLKEHLAFPNNVDHREWNLLRKH